MKTPTFKRGASVRISSLVEHLIPLIQRGGNACNCSDEARYEENDCHAGTISCADKLRENAASGGTGRHERLKDPVCKLAAQRQTQWDGDVLQRVARGKYASLHVDGNLGAHDGRQIGV